MYVVIGKSKVKAMYKAEKEVPTHKGGRPLTLDEYTAALQEFADDYYEKTKPSKLSPVFTNFSQAKEFRNLAKSSGSASHMSIKKMSSKKRNPKTGRDQLQWSFEL